MSRRVGRSLLLICLAGLLCWSVWDREMLLLQAQLGTPAQPETDHRLTDSRNVSTLSHQSLATSQLETEEQFLHRFVTNYPNNVESDVARFLAAKEAEYQRRREAVEAACAAAATPEFGTRVRDNTLVYDTLHGVSYCQIPKVNHTQLMTYGPKHKFFLKHVKVFNEL